MEQIATECRYCILVGKTIIHILLFIFKISILYSFCKSMASELQHECFISHSKFNFATSLMAHENSVHKDVKFGCQECGKQFIRKSVLNTHKTDIHDSRKHNCEQCSVINNVCGQKFK